MYVCVYCACPTIVFILIGVVPDSLQSNSFSCHLQLQWLKSDWNNRASPEWTVVPWYNRLFQSGNSVADTYLGLRALSLPLRMKLNLILDSFHYFPNVIGTISPPRAHPDWIMYVQPFALLVLCNIHVWRVTDLEYIILQDICSASFLYRIFIL